MKQCLVLGSFFITSLLFGQVPPVEHKGTMYLSQTVGDKFGLGGTYSISVHWLIYNDELTFIGRQLADSAYLHIDPVKMNVEMKKVENSFLIFTSNTQPIQCVYRSDYGNRVNPSNYDSLLLYDFQNRRVIGAIALEREGYNAKGKYRANAATVFSTDKKNYIFSAQYLVSKSSSAVHGYKLNLLPSSTEVTSLKDFTPKAWQTIEYKKADTVFSVEGYTDQTFPLGATIKKDKNNEYLGFTHNYHFFYNLKEKNWTKLSEYDIERDWTLIPGGKLLFTKTEKEVEKKDTRYYTTIVVYDIKNRKVEKQITLPDKKKYKVFFSQGKYAAFYEEYPDVPRFSPKLIDIETGNVIGDIPLPSTLEEAFKGNKKKLKASMAEILVANDITYNIKEILFSSDMKRIIITRYLDMRGSKAVFTVNGKQVIREEFFDVFEIK